MRLIHGLIRVRKDLKTQRAVAYILIDHPTKKLSH